MLLSIHYFIQVVMYTIVYIGIIVPGLPHGQEKSGKTKKNYKSQEKKIKKHQTLSV